MTNFIGSILGKLFKIVYDMISTIGTEPEHFSFYAMTVIITTVLFKLILLPLTIKQMKSTKVMGEVQPKMMALQEKYKNDPQNLQIKMAELYKEHNYNPASGCIMLLVQMPILIGFFKVMREPIKFVFIDPAIYEAINKSFFWIENLKNPDIYLWGLPLLAALTTLLQTKTMQTDTAANPQMESTQKTMNMVLPIMIFMSARQFPAGLALYWVVNNITTVIQQVIINKKVKSDIEEGN